MPFSIFTGNKFCIFNYATKSLGGFVDVDWFRISLPQITGLDQKEEFYFNYNEDFLLRQNFPNPFNSVTKISFTIPFKSMVKLKIYDLVGREIDTILSNELMKGNYTCFWNSNNLPSGIYIYQLQADNFIDTKKMVLLK